MCPFYFGTSIEAGNRLRSIDPRIEFGINLGNYDGSDQPYGIVPLESTKGSFFLLLLLHEYLRESSRILRVYKIIFSYVAQQSSQ